MMAFSGYIPRSQFAGSYGGSMNKFTLMKYAEPCFMLQDVYGMLGCHNISYELEKNVYFAVVVCSVLNISNRSNFLIILFK